MNNNKYSFVGKSLTFGNQKSIMFDYPIGEILEFPEALIVLLEPAPGAEYNENVFAIGWSGEKIWQIRPLENVYADSPYTKIYRSGENVGLSNWDGLDVIVDAKTGSILKKSFGK